MPDDDQSVGTTIQEIKLGENVCEVSTQVANNFAKVLCSESIFAFMETFMQPPGNTFDMKWC